MLRYYSCICSHFYNGKRYQFIACTNVQNNNKEVVLKRSIELLNNSLSKIPTKTTLENELCEAEFERVLMYSFQVTAITLQCTSPFTYEQFDKKNLFIQKRDDFSVP